MHIDTLPFLRLLQLADSALPIGSTAHSFGLESVTVEDNLSVEQLEGFLQDYLLTNGEFESVFCRLGHRLARVADPEQFSAEWLHLNTRLSAFKMARESRTASATLGRRFLQLVCTLEESSRLQQALQIAKTQHADIHYSIAFGLVGAILRIDETTTLLAYLQQALSSLISTCQRLLPLGQNQASGIVWRLKTIVVEIAETSIHSAQRPEELTLFTPLLDMGSIRHPMLATRLFIS